MLLQSDQLLLSCVLLWISLSRVVAQNAAALLGDLYSLSVAIPTACASTCIPFNAALTSCEQSVNGIPPCACTSAFQTVLISCTNCMSVAMANDTTQAVFAATKIQEIDDACSVLVSNFSALSASSSSSTTTTSLNTVTTSSQISTSQKTSSALVTTSSSSINSPSSIGSTFTNTPSTTSSSIATSSSSNPTLVITNSHSTPAGAIAGGVVGGLAVLSVLIAVLFWLRVREKRSRDSVVNPDVGVLEKLGGGDASRRVEQHALPEDTVKEDPLTERENVQPGNSVWTEELHYVQGGHTTDEVVPTSRRTGLQAGRAGGKDMVQGGHAERERE